LQAPINSGSAQAFTTVSLAKIGITHCCIETAVLLLRQFHPTLQGQYLPQFHTAQDSVQKNPPKNTPSYSSTRDVLELLNPTNAESSNRSILYGSATTFCIFTARNGSRMYISYHFKDSCRSGHHCRKCGKSHHTLQHLHFYHSPEPTILRFLLRPRKGEDCSRQ